MDILDEVLSTLRLRGALYCCSELAAPWGITFAARGHATFHVVTRGRCFLRVAGQPPLELGTGDLVTLPHGDEHTLSDTPNGVGRVVDFSDHPGVCGPMARWGGAGAVTRLVCGEIHVEEVGVHPLRGLLPRVMLHRAATARGAEWLDHTLALIGVEAEAARPGARAVIVRLVDVLFVQAIRAWLGSEDAAPTGWLRGLGDPQVAAALARMHRAPGEELTLEALASAVGMSRSSFCERFSRLVGEAPLEHLTRWRMHCSAVWLRSEPRRSLGEIAGRVGYQSEAAFCRAFKRVVGVSPGHYRRGAATPTIAELR